MAGYDSALLPELLPVYYKRLFPFKPFVQWLSYSNTKKSSYFSLREFAFILKDDVYLRYRSFTDQTELENEMRKECPFKLDIGAVFNDRVCL
uniref:Uncharacterized protein n=1 Tax=Plectus sambesii TaxID=2011161 RepID=A0A914V2W6_9BILA